MLNIDTLDNVIAVVVVILLLSLIVQSIQSVIKKLLKFKSKEIEASLLDLFDAVLRGRTTTGAAANPRPTKVMPGAFSPSPAAASSQLSKDLLAAVRTEMRELGRVTARGTFTVDSLSKGDLLNVLARVAPDKMIPQFTTKLATAMAQVQAISTAVTNVTAADLPGEANALFEKLRNALAPLQVHYNALITGTGTVQANLVIADVLALREVVFGDSLDLLGQVQKIVAAEKVRLAAAGAPVAALTTVEQSLATVGGAIGSASSALDDAFGSFKTKLTEIERWFDTTMQSFEERYERGMRTYSIIIAAVVVVVLNVNPFSLYRSIARNETLRTNLLEAGPQVKELQERAAKVEEAEKAVEEAEKKARATSAGGSSPAETQTSTDTAASSTTPASNETDATDTGVTDTAPEVVVSETVAPDTAASDTATTDTAATASTDTTATSGTAGQSQASGGTATPAAKPKTPQEQLDEARADLDRLLSMYTDFGFQPLTGEGLRTWFDGLIHCKDGSAAWWGRRGDDAGRIFGWLLMTFLLSLGAPFWHDALESLFGVKNLLRKRNQQQNIEQSSGAGNPKT